jgi:hypothetical protein
MAESELQWFLLKYERFLHRKYLECQGWRKALPLLPAQICHRKRNIWHKLVSFASTRSVRMENQPLLDAAAMLTSPTWGWIRLVQIGDLLFFRAISLFKYLFEKSVVKTASVRHKTQKTCPHLCDPRNFTKQRFAFRTTKKPILVQMAWKWGQT